MAFKVRRSAASLNPGVDGSVLGRLPLPAPQIAHSPARVCRAQPCPHLGRPRLSSHWWWVSDPDRHSSALPQLTATTVLLCSNPTWGRNDQLSCFSIDAILKLYFFIIKTVHQRKSGKNLLSHRPGRCRVHFELTHFRAQHAHPTCQALAPVITTQASDLASWSRHIRGIPGCTLLRNKHLVPAGEQGVKTFHSSR